MANEITVNLTFDLTRGNLKHAFRPGSFTSSWGASIDAHTVGSESIGTSAYESLPGNPSLNAGGWTYIRNTSTAAATTPYVEVARTSSTNTPFARVLPGECALWRNVDGALSAKAFGAAVTLQYGIFDP
jgi:hypothetical protein